MKYTSERKNKADDTITKATKRYKKYVSKTEGDYGDVTHQPILRSEAKGSTMQNLLLNVIQEAKQFALRERSNYDYTAEKPISHPIVRKDDDGKHYFYAGMSSKNGFKPTYKHHDGQKLHVKHGDFGTPVHAHGFDHQVSLEKDCGTHHKGFFSESVERKSTDPETKCAVCGGRHHPAAKHTARALAPENNQHESERPSPAELQKATVCKKAPDGKEVLDELGEAEYKVGDKVKALVGPHKGHPHEVIHVHDDGSVNIRPNIQAKLNKYRLGAAKASPKEIERLTEAKKKGPKWDGNSLTIKSTPEDIKRRAAATIGQPPPKQVIKSKKDKGEKYKKNWRNMDEAENQEEKLKAAKRSHTVHPLHSELTKKGYKHELSQQHSLNDDGKGWEQKNLGTTNRHFYFHKDTPGKKPIVLTHHVHNDGKETHGWEGYLTARPGKKDISGKTSKSMHSYISEGKSWQDMVESVMVESHEDVLKAHGYKPTEHMDPEWKRYEHKDSSHVNVKVSGGNVGDWEHKGKNKKLTATTGDSHQSLDRHLKKVASNARSAANRKDKDDALRSLGLTKVKGARGGTYWE